jgi:hypothetical protein
MESAGIRFAGADWQIELARFALPARVAPGKDLRLQLAWSSWGGGMPGPAGRDYTVFVHLRKDGTTTIANADATPTWYVAMPTSRWPVYQEPISWAPESTLDAHTLRVPADMAPGRYSVVVGWYDWQSGARLQVVEGAGNAGAGTPGAGNDGAENDGASEYVLGDVVVDPGAAQPPDLACLLTAEACASQ